MARPADFFVGITDLFGVILPGACLAFVGIKAAEYTTPDIMKKLQLSENESYIVFFVLAYLMGQLIDFGDSLLWDVLYDRVYRRFRRRDNPLFREAAWLAQPNMPVRESLYRWSQAWVCVKNPAAFLEIERSIATSQGLSGLVSVSLITGFVLLWLRPFTQSHKRGAIVCFVIAFLSFLRFSDLRLKAVQKTYRFFIVLHEGATASAEEAKDEDREDESDD